MFRKTLFISLLLFPYFLFAQNNGVVTGKVTEASSGQPLEFVTLMLMKSGDQIIIKQEITDNKGQFRITGLTDGTYYLLASYMGLDNLKTSTLVISPSSKKLVKNISLSGGTKKLNEVTVTGKKLLYSNSIDRKIYNVDQDIMAKSGSASEVLQNVPLVQVDIDGNVSLRNSSATILINGKVSPIMGKNAAAALQQLPANSIERIEVITNPSAKYKPDGTGGIINIVLKKNMKRGLNGGITANSGNQDRYNASVNLNYNPGKVNVFGSYNIKHDYRLRHTTNKRQTNTGASSAISYLDEVTNSSRPFSNTATFGMEYAINDKNSLGISGNYYLRTMHKSDLTTKLIARTSGVISDYDRVRNNDEYEREVDGTFFFEHNFGKEDHNIRLEFTAAHSPEIEDNRFVNTYRVNIIPNKESRDNTLIKQTSDNQQLTVGYKNQLGDDTKLELGYDGQYNRQDLDFFGEDYDYTLKKFLTSTTKTNRFIYNENIHAFYGTLEQSWKKFGAMLGLRGEYADLKSHQLTTSIVIPNQYFKVYPTFHLSYKFSNNRQLQLNYSRRVQRPEGDDLNPFAEYTDDNNIRVGNPYLQPEIIHSVEFGYQLKNDHFSILPGIYYRYKYNGFTSIVNELNGIFITSQQNLASDRALGADVVFSANVKDKLNINFTPNVFYNQIDGSNLGYGTKRNTITWSANFNSTYTITKSTALQVNSNYRSARLTPQGKYLPSFVLNFGARQEIFKKKGSVYLTISDVFKSQRQKTQLSSIVLIQDVFTRSNSRIAYLGMSYNFGILKKKKDLTFDNTL
ncbi:MAG: TonB-dependent receptor [Pedobacter sp.]|nr:TonB-dependent receptor [Pedobacter sp.]